MYTTIAARAVRREWVCHTRTVLLADAYGRQRCNIVLFAFSVIYLWCKSWAVCSLRVNETDEKLPVRTYKIGLTQTNTGNRLIHSRAKENFRLELKTRREVADGLPVSR